MSKIDSNTSTKIETFRPVESQDYMPDQGSALRTVHDQSHGDTTDERSQNDVRKHTHDGTNSRQIDVRNLSGFIRTVSTVPTYVPTSFAEQLVIYSSGGTFRLYAYDTVGKAWHYVVLT